MSDERHGGNREDFGERPGGPGEASESSRPPEDSPRRPGYGPGFGVVAYDPAFPIQLDRSDSCVVVGDLGDGRVHELGALAGHRRFFVDPKGPPKGGDGESRAGG